MENVLSLIRGDNENLEVEFIDESVTPCVPFNLTGYEVFFTVKSNLLLPDAKAEISKQNTVHTDPVNGITNFIFSQEETNIKAGKYHWDIQVKAPNGDINSCIKGTLIVYADVTLRNS